uniref:Uncharacterized protein n=1 Tax=Leersia perrieri TaxID=77586 RepID=A0A0D9V0Y7_9ORYZ
MLGHHGEKTQSHQHQQHILPRLLYIIPSGDRNWKELPFNPKACVPNTILGALMKHNYPQIVRDRSLKHPSNVPATKWRHWCMKGPQDDTCANKVKNDFMTVQLIAQTCSCPQMPIRLTLRQFDQAKQRLNCVKRLLISSVSDKTIANQYKMLFLIYDERICKHTSTSDQFGCIISYTFISNYSAGQKNCTENRSRSVFTQTDAGNSGNCSQQDACLSNNEEGGMENNFGNVVLQSTDRSTFGYSNQQAAPTTNQGNNKRQRGDDSYEDSEDDYADVGNYEAANDTIDPFFSLFEI